MHTYTHSLHVVVFTASPVRWILQPVHALWLHLYHLLSFYMLPKSNALVTMEKNIPRSTTHAQWVRHRRTHTHIKSLQCDNVILYSGHENELGNACSDVGFERVHLCFHVIPHSGGTVRRGNVKSMRVHGCFHGCMHVKCVLCRFCTVALTPLSLVWVCTVQLAFEAMLIPSVSPAFWQHDPSTTSIVSLIQDY